MEYLPYGKMGKKLVFVLLIFMSCSERRGVDSIIYIPENYDKNYILIFYDDSGKEKEYLNNKRLYKIPEDGVLITKFQLQRDKMVKFKFYKVNKENEPTSQLPIFEKTNDYKNKKYIGIGYHIYVEENSGFDCRFFYYTDVVKLNNSKYELKTNYNIVQKKIDSIIFKSGWLKN